MGGPKGGWHKVNDQAQGTKAYGSNCKNPRGNCDFSTKYSNIKWSNMLMASGDLKMWVTLPKSTVTSFNKINCRNCVLKLTGSSGSKSARQYMRQGNREDPWISAGNHPSHIVYGEGGYNGHNRDDALNSGGANVWVDSITPAKPKYDVKNGYAHMKYLGTDWYLVRRTAANSKRWHQANDQLAGTAAYGRKGTNPTKSGAFSVKFKDMTWGEMLLASGDM